MNSVVYRQNMEHYSTVLLLKAGTTTWSDHSGKKCIQSSLENTQGCKTFLGNLFHCLTVPGVKEVFPSILLELPFQFLTIVCQPLIRHVHESLHFLSLPPCRYWKAAIRLHQTLHFSRLKWAKFPWSPHLVSVFQPSDHLGGLQPNLLKLINIFSILGKAKTECTIPDVVEWVWSKGE